MKQGIATESKSRAAIINAVQTPLGFCSLAVLIIEVILGVLATRATGSDFTLLVKGMIGLLTILVIVAAILVNKKPKSDLQPSVEKKPPQYLSNTGLDIGAQKP